MKIYVKIMPYPELIKEHEELVKILRNAVKKNPSRSLSKLLDEQSAELVSYKKEYKQKLKKRKR